MSSPLWRWCMRRRYCGREAEVVVRLRLAVWRLLAPELAVNPRETVAMAAMAAIRFPNIIRVISPRGQSAVNPHMRMSFRFLDSHDQFIAGLSAGSGPFVSSFCRNGCKPGGVAVATVALLMHDP